MSKLKSRIVRIDRTEHVGSPIYNHKEYDLVLQHSQITNNDEMIWARIIYSSDPAFIVGAVIKVFKSHITPIKSVAIEYYNVD